MKNKTNYAKTMLFASLLAAMILPFSVADFADANQDDKQRIDAKKEKIDLVGEEIEALYAQISGLRAELAGLADPAARDPIDFGELERISGAIDARYDRIDGLQERAYKLFEIPEKRHEKLLEARQEIAKEYEGTGLLSDVFIDYQDESIQVILKQEHFESHKDSVKRDAKSIADKKSAAGADIGKFEVQAKYLAPSVKAGDVKCSQYGTYHSARDWECSHGTIAFPATIVYPETEVDVNGFVVVGHGFPKLLSSDPGFPAERVQVFQPGPDVDAPRGTVSLDSERLTTPKWQAQVIGTLGYGVDDNHTNHDAAFVELRTGKTVDSTVDISGNDHDITSYTTNDTRVGQYVYKSGIATGTSFGPVKSVGDGTAYAAYTTCVGDSGSPVGTVSRGDFTVYGMNVGLAEDETYFDQPDDCNEKNVPVHVVPKSVY